MDLVGFAASALERVSESEEEHVLEEAWYVLAELSSVQEAFLVLALGQASGDDPG